jgi:hypothetical protein
LRNALGSTPNCLENALEKWLRLAKPTAIATDFTGSCELRNSLAAAFRRTLWR